ncbi:hypothetical protein [Actinoplanes sp. NPDC051494]|uniref:hypothetical protein n=1 Tax=Actinoplanes sp. NPDC051494 TaxID=3363907 RepID=UPI0037B9B6A2
MIRRTMSIVAGVFISILASLMSGQPASAANAFEFNTASSSSWTGSDWCDYTGDGYSGIGCFDSVGDHFRIQDAYADGHSTAVYWHNYLAGSPNTLYRWGSCVNSLGAGRIGACNKNFTEGSKIEFKVCLYDNNSVTVPSNVTNYFNCSPVHILYA